MCVAFMEGSVFELGLDTVMNGEPMNDISTILKYEVDLDFCKVVGCIIPPRSQYLLTTMAGHRGTSKKSNHPLYRKSRMFNLAPGNIHVGTYIFCTSSFITLISYNLQGWNYIYVYIHAYIHLCFLWKCTPDHILYISPCLYLRSPLATYYTFYKPGFSVLILFPGISSLHCSYHYIEL
jgi:hypothetical protein